VTHNTRAVSTEWNALTANIVTQAADATEATIPSLPRGDFGGLRVLEMLAGQSELGAPYGRIAVLLMDLFNTCSITPMPRGVSEPLCNKMRKFIVCDMQKDTAIYCTVLYDW